MSKVPPNVLELPIAERGLMALKAALKKVIEEHAREGFVLPQLELEKAFFR